MKAYFDIVRRVLFEGVLTPNRTGVSAWTLPGTFFEHEMRTGFPLLTSKYVPFGLVASELEFFIKGLTDKGWLQARGNPIWNEWCNPEKVPYGHDLETRQRMAAEHDLGPIYGYQWRQFGAQYPAEKWPGIDQLNDLLLTLRSEPTSRRMLVSAWNPVRVAQMALPPCHFAWQVTVTQGRLNLLWSQRSVDVALGLPFNIASYGLLLHLLAKHARLEEGKLVGFLADTHIYEPHTEKLLAQINRNTYTLPSLSTPLFISLFDWRYTDTHAMSYQHHPKISFDICV